MKFAQVTSAFTMAMCAGFVLGSTVRAQDAQPAPAAAPPQTTAIVDPPIEQAPVIPAPAPVSGLTMPKWSEFPVPPKDVPTPADIAVEVKTQNDKARGLTNEVAALNWDPEDAETVRKETVARLDPDMMKPLDQPMSATAIEAFAADLRRKAVPPPVAN